jgi:hypothetical protein
MGLGRAAYSEDTSLTECLFVAKKKVSDSRHCFTLIGTKKPPEQWTSDEIANLAKQLGDNFVGDDYFSIRKRFPQSELLPENQTLSGLYLSLLNEYASAASKLDELVSLSVIPLIEFGVLTEKSGIKATECVFSGKQFFSYGPMALIVCQTRDRAIRATDRLYLDSRDGSNVTFRDKVSNSAYTFSSEIVMPAIRRFSYFSSLDITGKSDFCITRITPDVETLINHLYNRRESSRIIHRVREEWTKMVSRGSSKLCMMWRVDWAAAGTTLICVRHDRPVFLVIKGKYFSGISNMVHEKLLCMWFNSSPFIVAYLGRARITRGSYMDLEEYALNRCPVPDLTQLTSQQCKMIDDLWEKIKDIEVPSLIDQLESNHPFRTELDDGLLLIMGISDPKQRAVLASIFRRGAYSAIRALRDTMQ